MSPHSTCAAMRAQVSRQTCTGGGGWQRGREAGTELGSGRSAIVAGDSRRPLTGAWFQSLEEGGPFRMGSNRRVSSAVAVPASSTNSVMARKDAGSHTRTATMCARNIAATPRANVSRVCIHNGALRKCRRSMNEIKCARANPAIESLTCTYAYAPQKPHTRPQTPCTTWAAALNACRHSEATRPD